MGMVGSSVIRNAPAKYELIFRSRNELNLKNFSEVRNFFKSHEIEGVILCAAKVGGILANLQQPKLFLIENIDIQNSVMLAAQDCGVKNFAFLGSSCIYPKLSPQPIKEEYLLRGLPEKSNESYALAKIVGIKLMQAIHAETNWNYFSLMPSNLYGPNDNFDIQTSHVPAALMRRFHEAKRDKLNEVMIWGTGAPKREFLHVDDLANAIWYFFERRSGGELINIGSGTDLSIADFANLLCRTMGFKGTLNFDSSKPDGTIRKLLDISHAESLGWKHKIDLEVGIRQTYNWFVDAFSKGSIRGF